MDLNSKQIEQLTHQVEQLTCHVEELTHHIKTIYGLMPQQFEPLKLAAVALNQSETTLRKTVNIARLNPRKHRAKLGVHYDFNGNRILINIVAWQRDIKSIPPEKL
ncbi:hypothetical protein QT972_00280 [Microcoleus sp. herbarium7]|uniref:hypothetical protein n=1 Tax=Microcoleus sp. herbarium7 TaxID=3055435 RepID=UPI002FD65568